MSDKTKDPMASKREDHRKTLETLEGYQKRMSEGWVPNQNEGDEIDNLVKEASEIQKEIETYDERMKSVRDRVQSGRNIGDPILPPDSQPDFDGSRRKARRNLGTALDGNPVVGYIGLGTYVVASKGLHDFQQSGRPKSGAKLADVPSLLRLKGHREPVVPISMEQIKRIEESKAVPTIGSSVIEPTLVSDVVRVTENDRLTLRDILDVQQTGSDAVKYTRIVSYTRAAGTVANSAQKPEASMEIDSVTEPVRTVAVHMPVEEQQLSDMPQLRGLIDGELLYDVDKHLEELVMYGDGVGENFTGILNDPAVLDARFVTNDTLIDVARRAITDVRRAGYEPNGIMVDPLDWEEIVLEKGSENRYVWVVVTEGAVQRLWAVSVIETVAMEDFAGVETEERNMLVGDFQRGATLWDREQSSISVGWINDQFIRNQRTILAELRAAFGVKRPGAFRKYETEEASSS